ncbi:MAG: hypothetical protein ACHP6H_05385, partial [Legionellales bacterium]
IIENSDLSPFNTAAGYLVYMAAWSGGHIIFRNDKISSTPTITGSTWQSDAEDITLINTDSANTVSNFEYLNRLGTLTRNTSIYANNGAQFNGAGNSWKIVTTSSANETEPFVTPWMMKWNSSTSANTPQISVDWDSATGFTDRNMWSEFEYVSSASFPIGTLAVNRNPNPGYATGTTWGGDTQTWTGTGGFTHDNKQKVTSTFTPAAKSLMRGRLYVGVATTTLYVDPNLTLSAGNTAANPLSAYPDSGVYNETPAPAASSGSGFIASGGN